MAKQIVKKIKLQIPAGKATPAPPVGTVLGPAGINLQEFCTKFNDATRDKMGDVLPVEISLYDFLRNNFFYVSSEVVKFFRQVVLELLLQCGEFFFCIVEITFKVCHLAELFKPLAAESVVCESAVDCHFLELLVVGVG